MLRKLALCLMAWLPMQAAFAQITVSNPQSTVDPGNVLRYDMQFSSSRACYGYVEYGWFDGSDSLKSFTNVGSWTNSHSVRVIGLVPGQDYYWQPVVFDSTGCWRGARQTFSTSSPTGLGLASMPNINVQGNSSGYLLCNTLNANPDRYSQIFDRKGNLLWYETMPGDPSSAVDGPCQHINYFRSSNTIAFLECERLVEMDLSGQILSDFDLSSIAPGWYAHHDVAKTYGGNWLLLASTIDTVDKSAVGGSANALVVGPGMLEISPSGALLWTWSIFDHYNPLSSPGPGGDWVDKFGPEAINWLDANSVMEDLDQNPMLSFGGSSDVIKVNRSNGSIAWDCGLNGFVEILPADTFMNQHSLRSSRPGYYLSMDNQGLGNGSSRAIEWWIDFGYSNPTMMISWEYVLPTSEYSPADGSMERLPGNNILVASSEGKTITELDNSGTVVWKASLDTSIYKAFWVPSLYPLANPAFLVDTIVCLNDSVIELQASPAGGFWSGDFVNGSEFDAQSAGAGDHLVEYKFGGEQISVTLHVDNNPNCGVAIRPLARQSIAFVAFPNPFEDRLTLMFDLESSEEMVLEIFSLDGRKLSEKQLGRMNPGRHILDLDEEDLPARGAIALCLRSLGGKSGAKVLLRLD